MLQPPRAHRYQPVSGFWQQCPGNYQRKCFGWRCGCVKGRSGACHAPENQPTRSGFHNRLVSSPFGSTRNPTSSILKPTRSAARPRWPSSSRPPLDDVRLDPLSANRRRVAIRLTAPPVAHSPAADAASAAAAPAADAALSAAAALLTGVSAVAAEPVYTDALWRVV